MDILREIFYLAITVFIIGILVLWILGVFNQIKMDVKELFSGCIIESIINELLGIKELL